MGVDTVIVAMSCRACVESSNPTVALAAGGAG
jgi:hypothetical protein